MQLILHIKVSRTVVLLDKECCGLKNYVSLRGDWTSVWDKLKPSLGLYCCTFSKFMKQTHCDVNCLGLSAFQINVHYIRTSLPMSVVVSFKHGIY